MERTKDIQSAAERGDRYHFEFFVGGPDGFQQVAAWTTLQEAEEWLHAQGFKAEQA